MLCIHIPDCPWQECGRRQKRNNLNHLSSWCKNWTCSKWFQAFQCLRVPSVMDLEFSKQKNSLLSGFKSKWLLTVVISKFGSSTFSSLSKWKAKKKKNKNKTCLFLASLFYRWQSHVQPYNLTQHWHEWLKISALNMNISSSSSCDELIYLYPDFKLYLIGFCTVPCKAWK